MKVWKYDDNKQSPYLLGFCREPSLTTVIGEISAHVEGFNSVLAVYSSEKFQTYWSIEITGSLSVILKGV